MTRRELAEQMLQIVVGVLMIAAAYVYSRGG